MKLFTLFTSDARAVRGLGRARARLRAVLRPHRGPAGVGRARERGRGRGAPTRARERAQQAAGGLERGHAVPDSEKGAGAQGGPRHRRPRPHRRRRGCSKRLARHADESQAAASGRRPSRASRLLLDAAFLVPVERVARPSARACGGRPSGSAPHGYRVVLTGPWPAYNFVGRRPMSRARAPAADRRRGRVPPRPRGQRPQQGRGGDAATSCCDWRASTSSTCASPRSCARRTGSAASGPSGEPPVPVRGAGGDARRRAAVRPARRARCASSPATTSWPRSETSRPRPRSDEASLRAPRRRGAPPGRGRRPRSCPRASGPSPATRRAPRRAAAAPRGLPRRAPRVSREREQMTLRLRAAGRAAPVAAPASAPAAGPGTRYLDARRASAGDPRAIPEVGRRAGRPGPPRPRRADGAARPPAPPGHRLSPGGARVRATATARAWSPPPRRPRACASRPAGPGRPTRSRRTSGREAQGRAKRKAAANASRASQGRRAAAPRP